MNPEVLGANGYPDPREVAGVVLAAASRIDSRTPRPDTERLLGWAELFARHPMTAAEAVEGVRRHYLRPGAQPVLPGDVIGHVRDLRGGTDRYRTGLAAVFHEPDEPNQEYLQAKDELARRRAHRQQDQRSEGGTAS